MVDVALGWGKRIFCKSVIRHGGCLQRNVSLQAHLEGAKRVAGCEVLPTATPMALGPNKPSLQELVTTARRKPVPVPSLHHPPLTKLNIVPHKGNKPWFQPAFHTADEEGLIWS